MPRRKNSERIKSLCHYLCCWELANGISKNLVVLKNCPNKLIFLVESVSGQETNMEPSHDTMWRIFIWKEFCMSEFLSLLMFLTIKNIFQSLQIDPFPFVILIFLGFDTLGEWIRIQLTWTFGNRSELVQSSESSMS